MQLVFKAILQGDQVQERAQNVIHDLDNDENRNQIIFSAINPTNLHRTSPPNSHQSPINEDRQNQNSANEAYQKRSSHHSRVNSTSHTGQSTPERQSRDHDKHTNIGHDPSRQPVSSPDASRTKQSNTDSNQYSNDQLPLDNHPVPSNRNSRTANDDDIDGIHERSRSSSQNRKSPKYETSPLKRTDHSRSSPLLTSPKASPKSPESKKKYFFGENAQNPVPDEDSDGADCEAFGHNSQPKPLTNTSARRNLEFPSTTNSHFPMHANNNSESPQFEQQTDIGTATGNSLTQQHSSSPDQSTVGKTEDSLQNAQTYSPNRQTSLQANYETPDSYIEMPSTSLNQNLSNTSTTGFPPQYSADSDHYEQNLEINIKQEQPSIRFDGNTYEGRESPDEDDDPVEYEDDPHDRPPDNPDGNNDSNDDDDENDNLPRDDDSPHTAIPPQSGLEQLIRQNPVRDVPTGFQPIQYPASYPVASTRTDINSTEKTNQKKGGGFFGGLFSGNKSKEVSKNKGKSTQNKPTKSGTKAASKR
jgi:hypothetical protein